MTTHQRWANKKLNDETNCEVNEEIVLVGKNIYDLKLFAKIIYVQQI